MNLEKLHVIIDTMSLDEARDYCAVERGMTEHTAENDADDERLAIREAWSELPPAAENDAGCTCAEMSRKAEQAERRAEDAEAAIEATRDLLDGWEQDGPDDPAIRLLIQRVREMLDLGERFRAARPCTIPPGEGVTP